MMAVYGEHLLKLDDVQGEAPCQTATGTTAVWDGFIKNYMIHFTDVVNPEECCRRLLEILRQPLREAAKWPLLLSRNTELTALTSSCDRPHRKPQQPVQCGYCSSCILRKQALAASQLADKSHYIVPHGNTPAKDTKIYLTSMLALVSTLRERLKASDQAADQWKSLTQRFPDLNDIVDRTHTEENLTPQEMKYQFVRLFQAYVFEWDEVEQTLLQHFEKQQGASLDVHESQLTDQKELLCP